MCGINIPKLVKLGIFGLVLLRKAVYLRNSFQIQRLWAALSSVSWTSVKELAMISYCFAIGSLFPDTMSE